MGPTQMKKRIENPKAYWKENSQKLFKVIELKAKDNSMKK